MGESLNFLNDFWLVQAMKYSLWLYPTVESLHICGIGMLFGSVVLMDLRLLGVCPNIDFRAISRLGISVSMFGFTLAVLTGSMMFITHAADLIGSRLFVIMITNNLEPIRSAAWVINIIDPVSTAKVNPNILTDIPKRDIALKSILGHTPNSLRSIKTTLPNNIPIPQICKDSTVG